MDLNALFLILYQIVLLIIVIVSITAAIILIKNKKLTGYLLLIGTLASLIPLAIVFYISITSEITNETLGLLNNLATFIGIPTLIIYVVAAFKLKKSEEQKSKLIGRIQLITMIALIILLILQFVTLRT